jgi:hypothetical protein
VITKRPVASRAERLHQRIVGLLETLSGTPGIRAVRGALLRAADAAIARNDVATLEKLLREAKILIGSLPRGVQTPPATTEPVVERRDAGPGLSGWGRPRRSVGTSWRREHAPIQYPYGEPPAGWDTRLHDITTTVPDSRCSPDDLARIRAWRRSMAERAAAEAEAEHAWREHHLTGDSVASGFDPLSGTFRCGDPAVGTPAAQSCVVTRENTIRSEMGVTLRPRY